jgi:LacI family transcriptional regulator
VPDDISVLGFDDIEQAAFNVPRLTTIRQPLMRMGELAASGLIKRIEQPEMETEDVIVEPKLVVRESTAAPRRKPVRLRASNHTGSKHRVVVSEA